MKRVVILVIILAVLGGLGYGVWQIREQKAKAAKLESEILKSLTAEEVSEVLKSEAIADRPSIEAMQDNAEKRKAFLKGLHEYLALAAQARREGFANDENFKINLEYKKNIFLADLYQSKISQGKGKLYVVPKEEIEAVWTNPENEKLFERDMRVLREIRIADAKARGSDMPIPQLQGDMLDTARGNWARTKILSEMAKKDAEFINQPVISLRYKIIEAGLLAQDYLRIKWSDEVKVTDQDIADYLKAHPEYDVKKKLEKAQMVLAKAKAGEDFEKLAKEYTEDRASKDRGGLYKDVGPDVLWKEVEEAALKLNPGEIAANLIESHLGYHIVKLVEKSVPKNGDKNSLKYSVRHIVLQKKFEEPVETMAGIQPPFMTPEEIAKSEIEKQKRDEFINRIIQQNPIALPEDFAVVLPELKKAEPQSIEMDTTVDVPEVSEK